MAQQENYSRPMSRAELGDLIAFLGIMVALIIGAIWMCQQLELSKLQTFIAMPVMQCTLYVLFDITYVRVTGRYDHPMTLPAFITTLITGIVCVAAMT